MGLNWSLTSNMTQCKNESIGKHDNGSKAIECLECVEWLNSAILMVMPHVKSGIESNQTVAANYCNKFMHECNLQEIMLMQKRHEAIAAACSLIYNERLIRDRISDPKELERKSDDWARAQKEMKDRNRPKVEKKQLSDFEKAVAQLTNVGVSETDATSIVKERFAKQGKVTQ